MYQGCTVTKTSHLLIRYFLALLWSHPILHVSKIRVKGLNVSSAPTKIPVSNSTWRTYHHTKTQTISCGKRLANWKNLIIIYRHYDYKTTFGPEQMNKKLQLLRITFTRFFAPSLRKLPPTKKNISCKNWVPHIRWRSRYKKIRISEVQHIIQHNTNPTKVPGYDLITGTVLKELSPKCIRALTQIYNAILRLEYFPRYRKFAQIIMIVKPGKNPSEVTSYRPISLLQLLSKLLEKKVAHLQAYCMKQR